MATNGTTNGIKDDNKRQRMRTSDNEWQQMRTSDNEWQRVIQRMKANKSKWKSDFRFQNETLWFLKLFVQFLINV